jgi:microcystin-dependent protein
MAYEIPFTDDTNKGTITVEDNAINTETSLLLPGRNLQDYGSSVLTNFLHLMENFADVNPPSNPVEGQLWYDTTAGVNQLKIYDGTNWVAAGGLKKSTFEPDSTNSVVGDLWVDTTNTQLYLYSGSGWILVGPTYSDGIKTGALAETLVDTSDVNRLVIVNYSNNIPVSILSSAQFNLKASIGGWNSGNTIKIGLNLSPNVSGTAARINGVADRAENVVVSGAVVAGNVFMRKDETNLTNYPIQIRNNSGIEIGVPTTLSIISEGTTSVLDQVGTGSLDFRVSNSGVALTAMRVANDGKVGINKLNPAEALDVTGNIISSGTVTVNSTTDSAGPSTGSAIIKGGLGVAKQLWVGSSANILGQLQAQNILPDVAGIRSIGSSVYPYDSLYANRITGDLTGNVTGNISGTSASAAKLNTATTFQITGDISSGGFSFDGQTGGSTKTFTSTLNPAFVNDKSSVATVQSTDEFLVNRSGVLYKATTAQIISTVPTIQIGSIMMWPGFTAPTGWFICDGDEIALSTYNTLAVLLGYDALDATTWYWGTPSDPATLFRIPDYRGRMPVGLGLPGGANRISKAAAGVMGGVSGSEDITLTLDNLPEHEHDLKSSANEQFYATTTATATGAEVTAGSGDTAGTGTRLSRTGGILDGAANDAVDITNPFAAINFIIYHGVV